MNMVVWFSRIVEIAADRKKFTPKDNEMSNVILGVLEAAGKVDRERSLQGLKNMEGIGGFFPDEWEVPLGFEQLLAQNKESAKGLRALLESLPDKEQK